MKFKYNKSLIFTTYLFSIVDIQLGPFLLSQVLAVTPGTILRASHHCRRCRPVAYLHGGPRLSLFQFFPMEVGFWDSLSHKSRIQGV